MVDVRPGAKAPGETNVRISQGNIKKSAENLGKGKKKADRRSDVDLGFDLDGPVMVIHDLFYDGKAETRSMAFAVGEEGLKDAVADFGRDPLPGVGKFDC